MRTRCASLTLREAAEVVVRLEKWVAVALVAASLLGCTNPAPQDQCEPVPSVEDFKPLNGFGAPPLESMKRARACLHYEAYRLARVDADPRLIADAVMGACEPAIYSARLNSWLASFNSHDEGGGPPGFQAVPADGSGGPSCAKGSACETKSWSYEVVGKEADRKAEEIVAEMLEHALFRVVEAKAGHCPPPAPVNIRVP